MRRTTTAIAGLALLLATMVAANAAAGDGGRSGKAFSVGFQLQAGMVTNEQLPADCVPAPDPPAGGTSSGTWTSAGALADAGDAAACFRLAPRGDRLALDGALQLVSERGTITLAFAGIAFPSAAEGPASLLQYARVTTWRVTDGSGDYADLRARGKGQVVANLGRGDITVILDGRRRTS